VLNLVKNEWIKIFKRPGTYVMIGLIILGVIGTGILTKMYDSSHSQSDAWKQDATNQIKNDQERIDVDQKHPSSDSISDLQDAKQDLQMNQYRLDHNISPDERSAWTFISDNTMLISFTGLFTIIVAAGIVASEFNWGTIKLLLIRPVSRFKILLSKYITVVLFGLMLLAVLFFFSGILGAILFGGGTASNVHLAYVNGHVEEQNIFFYLVKTYLLKSIDIIMLATMAFMISAVFRNSSLAIGISIFLLFMGTTITVAVAQKYDWAKYILFANTDLTQYFNGDPIVKGMTMGFSIVMLILYFIVFHILAFGIFTKRDVAA
jgi:ABC-2 type transport system permease protein